MSRLAWKERVGRSTLLQNAYALSESLRSRAASIAGHPYEAARRLLHAWKHLGEAGIGRGRASRALSIIEASTRRDGAILPIAESPMRQDFLRSKTARDLRAKFGVIAETTSSSPPLEPTFMAMASSRVP